MTVDDIGHAADLIAAAMNSEEARWARKVMSFHFGCSRHGLDDGREYFLGYAGDALCGMVGLHHYAWGPEQNVWLAWFAVAPAMQRRGYGTTLMRHAEAAALERGFSKMLIETYDHPDFEHARSFYRARGFTEAGGIENYLPDGSSMVVYIKDIRRQS